MEANYYFWGLSSKSKVQLLIQPYCLIISYTSVTYTISKVSNALHCTYNATNRLYTAQCSVGKLVFLEMKPSPKVTPLHCPAVGITRTGICSVDSRNRKPDRNLLLRFILGTMLLTPNGFQAVGWNSAHTAEVGICPLMAIAEYTPTPWGNGPPGQESCEMFSNWKRNAVSFNKLCLEKSFVLQQPA